MSDQDISDDENDGVFVMRKKYTLILIDGTVSMQTDGTFESCLKDLQNIYAELKELNYLYKLHCGVIVLGSNGENSDDHCNVLIDIKSNDISKLINFKDTENVEKHLPLKEGIEKAVDLFYDHKPKKNDVKSIILITNNPKPLFENENEVISSGRLLKRNMVEFYILPPKSEVFKNSKFYELFFKQLDENMCELIQTNHEDDENQERTIFDILCEQLSPPEQRIKLRFYIDKYNYFEMIQQKLFQAKYAPYKKAIKNENGQIQKVKLEQNFSENVSQELMAVEPVLKIKLQVDDDAEDQPVTQNEPHSWFKHKFNREQIITESNHKAVFLQAELNDIDEACCEPKKNELYFMCVGNEPKNHVISGNFKSKLIKPNKWKADKTKFQCFWHHCIDNKKVLYCYMLGKKRFIVILKPMLFRNNPVFIKYGLGWADNYSNLSIVSGEENLEETQHESRINELMDTVVEKLKATDKTMLEIRDPKTVMEEALIRAKINKTSFIPPPNHVSMEYQQVNQILGEDLIDDFALL